MIFLSSLISFSASPFLVVLLLTSIEKHKMRILPAILAIVLTSTAVQCLPKKTWKSKDDSPEVDGESSRKIIGQR